MKRLLIIMGLVAMLASCKKLDKLTIFDLKFSSSFSIPSVPQNLVLDIPVNNVPINSSSAFKENNTLPNLIEEVKLKKLSLNITSPAGQGFDFISYIRVYISGKNLPEVEIANRYDIPENVGSTLDLNTLDVDLTEYAKLDSVNLRVNTATIKPVQNRVDIRTDITMAVNTKILGI
jgi:hypothetical protein